MVDIRRYTDIWYCMYMYYMKLPVTSSPWEHLMGKPLDDAIEY